MNIIFEGIDASGKTTLIRQFSQILYDKNIEHQTIADIKEPGPLYDVFLKMFNTNFLEEKQNFNTSLYQTLLFACNHFYMQEKNRNNKHLTIYDRDIFSILAYQKELVKKEYPDTYEKFFEPFREMLMFNNKKIDCLVYVSVPIDVNISRKEKRDGIIFSALEKQQLENFKKNMEDEIFRFSLKSPNTKVLFLDGRDNPITNCKLIFSSLSNHSKIDINQNMKRDKHLGKDNSDEKIF